MTVCGDGEYFRDYTYVSDIAAANILAMNSQKLGKGEVFNIGNGIPHSVNELVEMIGGDSVFVPERPGDVRFTQADYLKAKEFLNWEPKINLEEGLKLTKEFYGV